MIKVKSLSLEAQCTSKQNSTTASSLTFLNNQHSNTIIVGLNDTSSKNYDSRSTKERDCKLPENFPRYYRKGSRCELDTLPFM